MKIINKINPVAKLLGDKKYSKQVIPNKKKKKLDKLSEKEVRDAKTTKDS
jgi:hypothetical protein